MLVGPCPCQDSLEQYSGARIEIDGRCDNIGDFLDKATYARFRRTIAEHILSLRKALGR